MKTHPCNYLSRSVLLFLRGARLNVECYRGRAAWRLLAPLATMILFTALVPAQGAPRVTGVEPASGKVNDNFTVTGENLGKGSVSAVFVSDDKVDYKATVIDQSADKIVAKVPEVKPGDYNVSIQVGNNIFIQPVRFKVQ